MNAAEYRTELRDIAGVNVKITSYQIGEVHYCHVENLDPGATIARAEAATRQEAINIATQKAQERLDGALARMR